jgi:hypothetical protein
MGKTKLVVGLAAVGLAIATGGQVGVAEWSNLQFQDDLRDVSSMAGTRMGVTAPLSDDELRNTVIKKAYQRGISLEPKQVTVVRSGPAEAPQIYLAADYEASVTLPWYSFPLHFTPSSTKRSF